MKLKEAIQIPLVLLIIIWGVFIIDWIFNLNLNQYGIYPRKVNYLTGIIFSPFLHGSFGHAFSNSIPLFILGTVIIYFYQKCWIKVFLLVYIITGAGVWLAARPAMHIGASGVVYGFVGFLFFSGLFRKKIKSLLISIAVFLLYGGLIFGIFPGQKGISWESHLIGAIVGGFSAYLFRDAGQKKENDPIK